MANVFPWEAGGTGWLPYMVGTAIPGPDGQIWITAYDENSPTGVVMRKPDGSETKAIPAPFDQNAADKYWRGTPIGQRAAAQEKASAYNTGFDQDIRQGTLDINRQNANTTRQTSQAQVEQAKKSLQFQYAQLAQQGQLQQGQLGLSTLTLGSQLRGPRDWLSYMDATAGAGQNPMLQQAVGAWADLTNNRPRGTGAWNGAAPQKFDLNALASDFMGGGGGQGGGGSPRISALDQVARTPGAAAPGWWQSLGSDAQEMAKGYWEKNGDSPNTILNRLAYNQPTQGFGYSGV